MGGDSRQVGGDFLAKPLDPEGPPPAQTTLLNIIKINKKKSDKAPESDMPDFFFRTTPKQTKIRLVWSGSGQT